MHDKQLFFEVRNEDNLRNVFDEQFKTTLNVNGSFQIKE